MHWVALRRPVVQETVLAPGLTGERWDSPLREHLAVAEEGRLFTITRETPTNSSMTEDIVHSAELIVALIRKELMWARGGRRQGLNPPSRDVGRHLVRRAVRIVVDDLVLEPHASGLARGRHEGVLASDLLSHGGITPADLGALRRALGRLVGRLGTEGPGAVSLDVLQALNRVTTVGVARSAFERRRYGLELS